MVAVLDRRTQRIFSTGVRAVGAENDFYTLDKMKDPYCWEHFYADAIEPLMGNLISKITTQANLLVQNGAIIIHDFEKAQLAYIMIMQLLRGKQSREYERCLYQKYLPGVQESVKAVFAPLSNEQNELLQGFINDDYYFKRTSMDVTLHEEKIKKFSTAIYNHDFIFYRIQGNAEFVTSDHPVMFINSITGNCIPFSNGLLKSSTVIFYPISPKLLLCVTHPGFFFVGLSKKDCCLIDLNANAESRFIRTINRKQIEQCSQHAFAQSEGVLKQYITKK